MRRAVRSRAGIPPPTAALARSRSPAAPAWLPPAVTSRSSAVSPSRASGSSRSRSATKGPGRCPAPWYHGAVLEVGSEARAALVAVPAALLIVAGAAKLAGGGRELGSAL